MTFNATLAISNEICDSMVAHGQCDGFVALVAKQLGASVLSALVLQTAQIIAKYSRAQISETTQYLDYRGVPLDNPKEMGDFLRTQLITETAGQWAELSELHGDLKTINQTLWDREKSPAFVAVFTNEAKRDRDEGAILKLRKLCLSTHELAKESILGTYRACVLSLKGYLKI